MCNAMLAQCCVPCPAVLSDHIARPSPKSRESGSHGTLSCTMQQYFVEANGEPPGLSNSAQLLKHMAPEDCACTATWQRQPVGPQLSLSASRSCSHPDRTHADRSATLSGCRASHAYSRGLDAVPERARVQHTRAHVPWALPCALLGSELTRRSA